MVKNSFNNLKKSKLALSILVVLILILTLLVKMSFDTTIEKESFKSDLFGNSDGLFVNVHDSNITSNDPKYLKKITTDLSFLMNKYFGQTKFDRNLLVRSDIRNNYHFFYFTKKAPRLEVYKNKFLPEFESLGYQLYEIDTNRNAEYILNFEGSNYLIIINLLAYNSDDTMGIFMIYVEKLKK